MPGQNAPPNGLLTMTESIRPRKRYGRSVESSRLRTARGYRITTHLWPDVYQLLEQHCDGQGLTISGGAHDILRRYFHLNPLI